MSNASDVVYFPISIYTKDWFKQDLITESEYGVPVKLALNTLNGISEKQTLSILNLENNILKLHESFIPLQSSHTRSGDIATTKDTTKDKIDDGGGTAPEGGGDE
jgi:hypothetical protein